ncbi:hypothetical protein SFIMM107S_07447 [Streptomyces griseus]
MTTELHSPRRRRFDLFGFEVFRGLLAGCTDDAFADVEAALASGSNVRGSRERRAVPGFLGRSAALSRGCADVCLETLAAELLGGPSVYLYGDASEIHGDTYWHSDVEGTDDASSAVEGSPARLVKFVLYDTPLDGSNGALRLLPGSHRAPAAYPTTDIAPEDLPAHVLQNRYGSGPRPPSARRRSARPRRAPSSGAGPCRGSAGSPRSPAPARRSPSPRPRLPRRRPRAGRAPPWRWWRPGWSRGGPPRCRGERGRRPWCRCRPRPRAGR